MFCGNDERAHRLASEVPLVDGDLAAAPEPGQVTHL